MGGKSKPTIGYWYRLLLHFGLCRGPIDALREVRGGDRTAWAGRAGSGTIAIRARELWGGEKQEGGIEGDLDVMLGEPGQAPNAYLSSNLGADQTAYRGRATVVFRGGLYGAFNPYPKPASFLVSRVFKGWDGDVCWYPEKAEVTFGPAILVDNTPWLEDFAAGLTPYSLVMGSLTAFSIVTDTFGPCLKIAGSSTDDAISRNITAPGELQEVRCRFKAQVFGADDFGILEVHGSDGLAFMLNVHRELPFSAGTRRPTVWAANAGLDVVYGLVMGTEGVAGQTWYDFVAAYDPIGRAWSCVISLGGATVSSVSIPVTAATHANSIRFRSQGLGGESRFDDIRIITRSAVPGGSAMNAAHILYDSITSAEMQGEPVSLVDDANFRVAADRLHTEGFGLCTKYDPSSETVEAFQQRICNIIGGSLSQSRIDGKYYLTLIRGDYVLASLPILQDDDILEYQEEPSDPLESVNQVTVEWFDPVKKEKRSTSPLQALGAIQAAGGIIAEVAAYPEIPTESLALRVGARDLSHKSTPLKRFELTTNRIPYAWRASQFFRLQAPRRGIADMVCMVGEIDAGTPRSGTIRLLAIQDVSGMPTTTYVAAEPGVDTSPSQIPTVPAAQQIIESPYLDLAGALSRADLAALTADAGYLLTMAKRPTSGLNYLLFTAAGGQALVERGRGDWCPSAKVVAAAPAKPSGVSITLSDASDLDLVVPGTSALWGAEICRVESINLSALTVVLARGCADTVPQAHAAGEWLWFYDGWSASDAREYVTAEVVSAQLRTRTVSRVLNAAQVTTQQVTMAGRAARPYPPGRLRISDAAASQVAYPASAVGAVTVSWAHRDRALQVDKIIDSEAASIGPEPGTTYTVRYYLGGVLEHTQAGVAGTSATPYTFPRDGLARVEVSAVRNGLLSWQAATAEFSYLTKPRDTRITVAADTRVTVAGDVRTTLVG